MSFVPPTWLEGMLIWIGYILITVILGILVFAYTWFKKEDYVGIGLIVLIICIVIGGVGSHVLWFENYEVQSVQEKVITVDNWQPVFGKYWGEIESADDLMLQTTDGELFVNKKNLFFQKFNTRDILNGLHVNGTYKIKYYGWREGYNNGAPNILSISEVINDNGTQSNDITHYMNKRSIVYDDQYY